jgi:diaminopimelate decarboxylase
VISRKESRGKAFLVVDGGMHHRLATSGNIGQVTRRNHPPALGTRTDAEVGAASEVELRAAEIGDLVVVFQAAAYSLTPQSDRLSSATLPPAEILV